MSEICVDLTDFEELNYFCILYITGLFDIWLRVLTMSTVSEELVCSEKCLQRVIKVSMDLVSSIEGVFPMEK